MNELRTAGQNGKNNSQSRTTRQADTCFVHTNTTIPTFQKTWSPVTVEFKSGYIVRTGKEGELNLDVETAMDTRNIWKKQGWAICTMRLPTDNGASFVNDIANSNGKMVYQARPSSPSQNITS